MKITKKDFIEIEFTGKVKDGDVFDSNIKEDLDKAGLKFVAKPFIFCLGEGMFLQGIEDFLIDKEIGKDYVIELEPKDAFGNRNSQLIKMIPKKVFDQQGIRPTPGAVFNFDNKIGKILTVSGGRIVVDFNNPLAGKDVVYDIKVLRKVEDLKERVGAFVEFLFKKKFEFDIEDKKLIIKMDKQFLQFGELFKPKFKEIFDLDLEIKEIKTPKTVKPEEILPSKEEMKEKIEEAIEKKK